MNPHLRMNHVSPHRRLTCAFTALLAHGLATTGLHAEQLAHPWPHSTPQSRTLADAISTPEGFTRLPAVPQSFAGWLRRLPMKPAGSAVKLFNGAIKPRQDVHAAVIDIDTGDRDLQQCADAVMRLRAEWLWSTGANDAIAFDYTGGGRVAYTRFASGARPSESGKSWRQSGKADSTYAGFRRYMTNVFIYAGTYSLARELRDVAGGVEPEIGDVIIKGGFPGHAVLVVDKAENAATRQRRYLLAQSYMPAQDIHILKNPAAADGSPWYSAPIAWPLVTPEWTFPEGSLKRWR